MSLNLQGNQNASFGYESSLKKLVSLDAYTGKTLSREERTLEHIKPHSDHGTNTLNNYLIVSAAVNEERGNMPFTEWLKRKPAVIKNIQNYLDKVRGLKIGELKVRGVKVEGVDYVEAVKQTLNREAHGMVTFRGNNHKKLNING